MSDDPEILFATHGPLGRVTLNRPRALNAVTHNMCLELHARLRAWVEDDGIKAVVVDAAGERAFSAGGDVRWLYERLLAGSPDVLRFYWDEYRLNRAIKHYPKPYVALIDGIVMGGGVGVSVHGSHRVATERITFAMPETGIGLFPDVGGTYFLSRCPGEAGMDLALTGTRVGAADALDLGLATHRVSSERLVALIDDLAAAEYDGDAFATVDRVLTRHAGDTGEPPLAKHRPIIDRCFSGGSVDAILAALDAEGGSWAPETAATIRQKSPTSTRVAFRQIRAGRSLDFDDCMRLEYRLVNRFMAGHDFREGVRALVIDKDQSPRWSPATLSEVTEADVDRYFETLGTGELAFD